MKRPVSLSLLLVLAALTAAGCASSNRLDRYDFTDRVLAVSTNIPPQPEVFTGDLIVVDGNDLLATIARTGSAVVKEVQAERARARLDEAERMIDVSGRLADRTLERSARYLRARITSDDREADFLLDVFVRGYGIDADSWQARAYFFVDADVVLIDAATGRRVWRARVKERDPITPAVIGSTTVGNVVTAEALGRLSADEMVVALEHLADFSADRVTLKLREDFLRARR